MNQATLEFGTLAITHPGDHVAFEIGWDHARHALVPPAELLLPGSPVAQGWQAARAVFGRRHRMASRLVRLWLDLRLRAWREGQPFETTQVTPNYLSQLEVAVCPVTRRTLGGARDGADAPVFVRLSEDAGYAAGNLAVFSRAAAQARAGCSLDEAWQRTQRLERGEAASLHGLDADGWARVATLISLATPLPHARALRIPLRALPPNRARLLNAVQGLQALLTLHLAAPGWSQRARALADALPAQTARHDYNLFVGALAPRLLEALRAESPRERAQALEDAWADIRVLRRWQLFAAQLDEAQAEALAARLAQGGLPGRRVLVLEADAATEGWSLPVAPQAPQRPPLPTLRRRAPARPAVAASLPKRRAGDLHAG